MEHLPPLTTSGNALWSISNLFGDQVASSGTVSAGEVSSLFLSITIPPLQTGELSFELTDNDNLGFNNFSFLIDGVVTINFENNGTRTYTQTFSSGTYNLEWRLDGNDIFLLNMRLDDIVLTTIRDHAVRIQDGSQGTGKILVSDEYGNAYWKSPTEAQFTPDPNTGTGIQVIYPDNPPCTYDEALSDGDGLFVINPPESGLEIRCAGSVGLDIYDATNSGIRVSNAGNDGIDVFFPSFIGLDIFQAGNSGIRVIESGNFGLQINSTNGDGINIFRAGRDASGSIINQFASGVYVEDAAYDGFHSSNPDRYGFYSSSPGIDSYRSENAGTYGFSSFNSGSNGFYSATSGTDGFRSISASDDGFSSFNSGDNGLDIFIPNGRGIQVVGSSESAAYLENEAVSTNPALIVRHGDDTDLDIRMDGDGRIASQADIYLDLDVNANGGNNRLHIRNSNGDNIVRFFESGNGSILNNWTVGGNISKGGGSFKIDHPLDPENKYLYHSFVESPDMMNIYNGNTYLDSNGEAFITLPDWFEPLNRDFRYQLTAIGAPGPNLYVAEEITGNQFKIAGGTKGMKVSWQVTGIRQDPYANTNRIQVEVEKAPQHKGRYLHAEAYSKTLGVTVPKYLHEDGEGEPNFEKEQAEKELEQAKRLKDIQKEIEAQNSQSNPSQSN